MKKFIFSFIFCACLSVCAMGQTMQIPTIHVVEFNLDSLKAEVGDSALYFSRLQELKMQLKQEQQEIKSGLDIVKSGLKNQNGQYALAKERIKLLTKQTKTHEKGIKSWSAEIKSIEKEHKKITNNKNISYHSKLPQLRTLESRKNYLEQQIASAKGKIDMLTRDLTTATDELHRLERVKLDIQSSQIELKRLNEACKFKQKQLNDEIKLAKSKK